MAEALPLKVRLMRRVVVSETGCWLWTGALLPNGYGYMWRGTDSKRNDYPHRISYELHVGPIPEGLHIDHLCRNRACCNPQHLEPVTCLENVRRGQGNNAKTHCAEGHPYDEVNTKLTRGGRRHCRICVRARKRELYWRKKAQAAPE